MTQITLELLSTQRENFEIIKNVGYGIITTLGGVIIFLGKLYIDTTNKNHENEKLTQLALINFTEVTKDLHETLKINSSLIKDNNHIINKVSNKIDHPVITSLLTINKEKNA